MMGAANAGEVRMGLFSVTLPVIAILHDDLPELVRHDALKYHAKILSAP